MSSEHDSLKRARKDRALAFLNGAPVTAVEIITVARISPANLSSYLARVKPRLPLCSESAGQGKARQFCLIDLYLLNVFDRVVAKTKSASLGVSALECLLLSSYHQATADGTSPFRNIEEAKRAFCEDIFEAQQEFWDRDILRPWFLYEVNRKWNTSRDPATVAQVEGDMTLFQLTLPFRALDLDLARIRGFPVDRHYGKPSVERLMKILVDSLRPPPKSSDEDRSDA